MRKKILIAIILLLLIAGFVFFVKYKIVSIENLKGDKEQLLILKNENNNEIFNFLKPSAVNILDYADLIIYKNPKEYDKVFSKKENHLSRVLALPGDRFEIRDSEIYINDQNIKINYNIYLRYRLTMNDSCDFNKILQGKVLRIEKILTKKSCNIIASESQIDSLRNIPGILNLRKNIVHYSYGSYDFFPNSPTNTWNEDNFGPLVIPKKSLSVELNRKTYDLYKKIIDIYENKILENRLSRYYIDGVEVKNYTFEKDYYFVINDDRTNTDDSRKFGFIPEDEIYGKVLNK